MTATTQQSEQAKAAKQRGTGLGDGGDGHVIHGDPRLARIAGVVNHAKV